MTHIELYQETAAILIAAMANPERLEDWAVEEFRAATYRLLTNDRRLQK